MSTTWTQEAPAAITFDAVDGSNNWKFIVTNIGTNGFSFSLQKNGDPTNVVPNTQFIKDLFTQVGNAL